MAGNSKVIRVPLKNKQAFSRRIFEEKEKLSGREKAEKLGSLLGGLRGSTVNNYCTFSRLPQALDVGIILAFAKYFRTSSEVIEKWVATEGADLDQLIRENPIAVSPRKEKATVEGTLEGIQTAIAHAPPLEPEEAFYLIRSVVERVRIREDAPGFPKKWVEIISFFNETAIARQSLFKAIAVDEENEKRLLSILRLEDLPRLADLPAFSVELYASGYRDPLRPGDIQALLGIGATVEHPQSETESSNTVEDG